MRDVFYEGALGALAGALIFVGLSVALMSVYPPDFLRDDAHIRAAAAPVSAWVERGGTAWTVPSPSPGHFNTIPDGAPPSPSPSPEPDFILIVPDVQPSLSFTPPLTLEI